MPDAIAYCDACGKLVPPSDITRGDALVSDTGAVCSACAAKLNPDDVAHFRRSTSTRNRPIRKTPRPGSATSRRTPVPQRPQANKLPIILAGVGATVGVLTGVIVVALLTDEEPPAPRTALPSVAVPLIDTVTVPKATVPAADKKASRPPVQAASVTNRAAKDRLVRIRGLITPELGRYADIIDGLDSIARTFPDSSEAQEAATLKEQVNGNFAALADAELARSIATARELTAAGRYSTARSILRLLRPRFADSAWYAARGEAAIKAAMEEVDTTRDRVNAEAKEAMKGARPLYNVTFNNDTLDRPPSSATPEPGAVSQSPSRISVKGKDTITVRSSLGGLTDRPIEYACANADSGEPSLGFLLPEPADSGRVIVAWESAMVSYPRSAGVETALTFRFRGRNFDPMFAFTYVHGSTKEPAGTLNVDCCAKPARWAHEADKKWSVGAPPDRFWVVVDLDANTLSVWRNDKLLVDKNGLEPRNREGGLRGLTITDGRSLGSRGGAYTAVIDNIRIAVPTESE